MREYFEKRYREKGEPEKITPSFKRYSFYYFFKVNNKTKEKVDIFNKLFHTNYK